MTYRWLLFAILAAIVEDAAEMAQERSQVSDVVVAETLSAPDDRRETVVETSTFAVETSLDTTTDHKKTNTVDDLRNRVVQQTDELNKAIAALTIAQQHEQRLATLEREKYGYVKKIENKVLCIMDNAQFPKNGPSDDTSVIQHRPTCRTSEQSSRRLQIIRRLLAGAELGLVQMQSIRKLSVSNTDRRKK